ncbi:MAG: TolC family protein [Nitrospirae bacterium]|nr:TolC family protein [Nitrospirota bacterium]
MLRLTLKCSLSFFVFILTVTLNVSLAMSEIYSLEDLYRIALERSERIRISQEDMYIAEAGRDKAVAALLPKLSGFADYTQFSTEKYSSAGSVIQPDNSLSWGLRLDQTLSLSGREFTALNISRDSIERSRHDLSAVKEAYLFNVASAYYDALRAGKALEIANANIERLSKHRAAADARLRVGEVTKTDLLRAEAELSGSKSDFIKAENHLKLTRAVLARIVGLAGDYKIADDKQNREEDIEEKTIDLLKETAFSERAEMQASAIQKKIAEDQVGYARGSSWPTISIEAVYSKKEENPATAFLNKESIYGGLKLNFPFFEGGMRKAEVKESEARHRQAELLHEDLKKAVGIEVVNAHLDFLTQKGVLKSLESRLMFAKDNHYAVSKQYEFGLASSIDVIDANTLLLTAERQLADAGYYYQLSILRLKRTTGTLLKTIISQHTAAANHNIKEK